MAIWQAPHAELIETGLDKRAIESLEVARTSLDLERLTADVDTAGFKTLCWDDVNYPRRLREIDNPPPLLYVSGELIEADDWAVAIVGTRRATAYGKQVAEDLAAALALAGATVVSGFARGIDGAAHLSALEAGGRTLAVLGSGLDKLYPAEHSALAERLLTRGLW